jgi:hypothetical protein
MYIEELESAIVQGKATKNDLPIIVKLMQACEEFK